MQVHGILLMAFCVILNNDLFMKTYKIILLFLSSFLFCGCPMDPDENIDSIHIRNISDRSILVASLRQVGYKSPSSNSIITIRDEHSLYDTILHIDSCNYFFHILEKNWSIDVYSWDGAISESLTDTMTIFIFDKNVCSTIRWEKIVEENKVLARYDIPVRFYLDNFDNNNNHPITYPPTDEMSEIVVRYYNDKRDK